MRPPSGLINENFWAERLEAVQKKIKKDSNSEIPSEERARDKNKNSSLRKQKIIH
jgi:hypothetical protein